VSEGTDLKARHPTTVKQMLEKLEAWQKTLPGGPKGDVFSAERN